MKAKLWLPIAVVAAVLSVAAAPARLWADDFYKGKTIRFVVGLAPGGGYDLSARTVGRHIGKHMQSHYRRREHDRRRELDCGELYLQ